MKFKIKRKILLELTLDSSETIMFTKSGKHTIKIGSNQLLDPDYNENDDEDYDIGTEIEISVQMERDTQGRFNFITEEANKHKKRIEDET